MVGQLAGAFAAAERYGFGRAVGAWFADALLAQRLGWTYAVPLLGTEEKAGLGTSRPRRAGPAIVAGVRGESSQVKNLLARQVRAALRANLQRRKAQARARAGGRPSGSEAAGDGEAAGCDEPAGKQPLGSTGDGC